MSIDVEKGKLLEPSPIGPVDEEARAHPRLETAGGEVVAVEIEQPLGWTTPGEAIGETMDLAVVEGEHERRVDRVRRSTAAASGAPTFPACSPFMAGRYDIGLARKKGAASGALEIEVASETPPIAHLMPETQNHATVLVTGAALRLGRAIALDLAKHGWRIGVHHHTSGAEAQSLVEEIERLGSKAVALPADLTREDQLRGLVQSCAEELGPPTCLINNAARFEWDSIDTLDWAAWQAELDVNLRAPIFLSQAFARTLPKDAHGCVINMIDQRVWRLTPEFFSYTIAKSALWTATRTLAQALAPRIRVNAIGPGPVLPSLGQSQADFERECRATPLGRAATMEEVCRAVRFLLDSPSVTGQMIALDSGQHLAWR